MGVVLFIILFPLTVSTVLEAPGVSTTVPRLGIGLDLNSCSGLPVFRETEL
jgi:hypothetical protein